MTSILESAECWFGLCRKQPAIRILQVYPNLPLEPAHEGLPGGGNSGGSGAIHRGIGAALSGLMTLARNRQLLWFTLLAGLVLAGSAIAQGALGYITWTMQSYIGETEWVLLNFIIEFFTLFFLVFLLAALVLGISRENGGSASSFEGLRKAKTHAKAIAAWSLILAFVGMLLFSLYFYSPGRLPENSLSVTFFGTLSGSVNLFSEFPFNPTFNPYTFFDPLRDSGSSPAFWIFPSGIMQALTFSAINLLLFILTLFVVPLLVREQKNLREAIAGSFTLLKKTWVEVTSCVVFLGIMVFGVFFTYLLVQAASGMAAPGEAVSPGPENTWIALALVYDSILFCFAMVMATVGGIAALEIYTSTKSRPIPGSAEDLPEVR